MHEEGGKPFHMAASPAMPHVVQVSAFERETQVSALGKRQDDRHSLLDLAKTIQLSACKLQNNCFPKKIQHKFAVNTATELDWPASNATDSSNSLAKSHY
jgi:hypothetical protein